MDPLTQLKMRKPWRGHLGQRALVPGRLTQEVASSSNMTVHDMGIWVVVLLAMTIFIGMADTLSVVGWTCWGVAAALFLLQCNILRGIAWRMVAAPLDRADIKHFQFELHSHPDLMVAAMHWLEPDTTLRQVDLRLLRRAKAYVMRRDYSPPSIDQARADYLKSFTRVVLCDERQDRLDALNLMAQELARQHAKPWKLGGWMARGLNVLARKKDRYTRKPASVWSDWLSGAGMAYFVLVLASWLVHSWMGIHLSGWDIFRPFGVEGITLLLLLISLPVPLATMLSNKRLPLSAEEIQALKGMPNTYSEAAHQYLSHLPAGHDWSANDVKIVQDLAERSNKVVNTPQVNLNIKITLPQGIPNPIFRDDIGPCVLSTKKPWQGHWWQKMLQPTAGIRDLGNDLSGRPKLATAIILIVILALMMPFGALVSSASFLSWVAVSPLILAGVQIELLRLICYLHVSAPVRYLGEDWKVGPLTRSIPGAHPIVSQWCNHPAGLRMHDYRLLKKCARRFGWAPDDGGGENPEEYDAYPQMKDQADVLKVLHAATLTPAVNEAAQRQAANVGKAWDLWGFTRKASTEAMEFFMVGTSFFYKLPTVVALLSVLLVAILYAALAGAFWIVSFYAGMSDSGNQVFIPLGGVGTLCLAAGALALLAGAFFFLRRSIAPPCVLTLFSEEYANSLDAGSALPYLEHLPKDRYWTFLDMFRARKLILREQLINEKTRENADQARQIETMMETREAKEGISCVQSEALRQATAEIETQAAPAPRRRL